MSRANEIYNYTRSINSELESLRSDINGKTILSYHQHRIAEGKLYEEYSNVVSEAVVDRAYRNYMKKMVELGLIKVEGSGRWKVYDVGV